MRVLALALLIPNALAAQTLPALYDVAGVVSNDVLNIRAKADAGAALRGSLPFDAKAIEVVALSPDGAWGQVNTAEAMGWVALRFLHRQDRPDWFALQDSLVCSGTEPFWTLYLDPKSAHINTPDEEGPELDLPTIWPGSTHNQTAAVQYVSEDANGMAVLRGQACSDGMSDQSFGITVDLFQAASPGHPAQILRGCCNLAP